VRRRYRGLIVIDIAPCLWFDGQAEEAARFYCSVFPRSEIGAIMRCGEGMRYPPGAVLFVEFTLDGQRFQALNGGPQFNFSEAISLSVPCADQAEVDRYWEALTADGGVPGPCSWLKDKFGVSWQIVPRSVSRMQRDGSPAQIRRMMDALMKMSKLDVAVLEAAYAGQGAD
jgi:predicted 3-demethylubiquinone-9 3-methyltransferase (glyoxalase superfamily)